LLHTAKNWLYLFPKGNDAMWKQLLHLCAVMSLALLVWLSAWLMIAAWMMVLEPYLI
jgi:hypothetical protein